MPGQPRPWPRTRLRARAEARHARPGDRPRGPDRRRGAGTALPSSSSPSPTASPAARWCSTTPDTAATSETSIATVRFTQPQAGCPAGPGRNRAAHGEGEASASGAQRGRRRCGSPGARQLSTPPATWNCPAVIRSVMPAKLTPGPGDVADAAHVPPASPPMASTSSKGLGDRPWSPAPITCYALAENGSTHNRESHRSAALCAGPPRLRLLSVTGFRQSPSAAGRDRGCRPTILPRPSLTSPPRDPTLS
jgi:hypothetical protein